MPLGVFISTIVSSGQIKLSVLRLFQSLLHPGQGVRGYIRVTGMRQKAPDLKLHREFCA